MAPMWTIVLLGSVLLAACGSNEHGGETGVAPATFDEVEQGMGVEPYAQRTLVNLAKGTSVEGGLTGLYVGTYAKTEFEGLKAKPETVPELWRVVLGPGGKAILGQFVERTPGKPEAGIRRLATWEAGVEKHRLLVPHLAVGRDPIEFPFTVEGDEMTLQIPGGKMTMKGRVKTMTPLKMKRVK